MDENLFVIELAEIASAYDAYLGTLHAACGGRS